MSGYMNPIRTGQLFTTELNVYLFLMCLLLSGWPITLNTFKTQKSKLYKNVNELQTNQCKTVCSAGLSRNNKTQMNQVHSKCTHSANPLHAGCVLSLVDSKYSRRIFQHSSLKLFFCTIIIFPSPISFSPFLKIPLTDSYL